jgi:RHS repeat-associated protein
LTDHLGTARDLAEYNAGTDTTSITNHRVFDSFGNLVSETNAAVDHLFGFTARPWDEETDLQYNLNRWYDPVIGQWMSEDPIGFAAGDASLRRAVENRTLSHIDPSGLSGVGKIAKGAAKDTAYQIAKNRLRALIRAKLVQIHHLIPRSFFKKHAKYSAWFKTLGIAKHGCDNVTPLPTVLGKLAGIGGKRAIHYGKHLDTYFRQVDELLAGIYARHQKGLITDAQAASEIASIQKWLRTELRAGRLRLQNEEELLAKYASLALITLGLSESGIDSIAESVANDFVDRLDGELSEHCGNYLRLSRYSGEKGIAGWIGWGADFANPGDDIATM